MVIDDLLLDTLRTRRLLAIVRGRDRDAVVACGLALIDCGITCLEVSLTSADAFEAITRIVESAGAAALVGVGTVLTKDDAVRARDAGAQFAVTPGLGDGVDGAAAAGLPVIGGALTPTEVIAASTQCVAVKLFPASVGGPDYLRALRAPFPRTPFVAVGGIDADSAGAYLSAGAIAIGVGSPLIGDAADGGSIADLRHRSRAFLDRISASF
jgi:2-dehydro-3-deoxyphosphogluconate aldolase/(4S)-4-hydroxy-2-oxoglutarate aldolase